MLTLTKRMQPDDFQTIKPINQQNLTGKDRVVPCVAVVCQLLAKCSSRECQREGVTCCVERREEHFSFSTCMKDDGFECLHSGAA